MIEGRGEAGVTWIIWTRLFFFDTTVFLASHSCISVSAHFELMTSHFELMTRHSRLVSYICGVWVMGDEEEETLECSRFRALKMWNVLCCNEMCVS